MFNWQPFLDLINSKDCTHEYQLLNFSDLKKVDKTFSKTRFTSQKQNTFFQQKNFGPNVIYWLPHPPAAARSIQEQLWESKVVSNHKMILKCVFNDSEMLFNDFEMFCL